MNDVNRGDRGDQAAHRRSRVLPTGRGTSESFLELDWSLSVLEIVVRGGLEEGVGGREYKPEPIL